MKRVCYFVAIAFAAAFAIPQVEFAQEAAKFSAEVVFEREGDWKPLFQGIDGLNLTVTAPRKMKAYAARIALDAPGIELVSTPDNGARPKETDGATTSTFLKRQKCQLAINAGAFSPVTDLEGTEKDITGLHISEGKITSPWQHGYDAVIFREHNEAKIIRSAEEDFSAVRTAVSGFNFLLWEGEVMKGDESIHPRTVLGLSKDAKWMYWLVIDGRQTGYSDGAKTREAATILQKLGAYSGINLDGGGTSTMVMEKAESGAKVLNRPIHRGIPGLERPGASHLGVRALKLSK